MLLFQVNSISHVFAGWHTTSKERNDIFFFLKSFSPAFFSFPSSSCVFACIAPIHCVCMYVVMCVCASVCVPACVSTSAHIWHLFFTIHQLLDSGRYCCPLAHYPLGFCLTLRLAQPPTGLSLSTGCPVWKLSVFWAISITNMSGTKPVLSYN